MERVKSIFGSLLRRRSSYSFKKAEVEKENRKQDKIYYEFVEPTIKIFEGNDFKTWYSARYSRDGDERNEEKSLKNSDDSKEFKTDDMTDGAEPTEWEPEEKLKEYTQLQKKVQDIKEATKTVSDDGIKAEELHDKLAESSLQMFNAKEDLYTSLMSRYPGLHRLGVDPVGIAIHHYATKFPELYRQGSDIAENIRPQLWKIASLSVLEKHRTERHWRLKPADQRNPSPVPDVPGYYSALLAKIKDSKAEVSQKQKLVYEQIDKDIHRTLADESFFGDSEENCQKLRNILAAFSLHHPRIGYCQSMNFVAGGVLMALQDEEAAFWIFSRLILRIMPRDYYTLSMAGVVTDVQVLTRLLKTHLPAVDTLLNKLEVKLEILACHMLMSLCFGAAPTSLAQRCMDLVLAEGSGILVCVVLAMIVVSKEQIMSQDDAGDMMLLLAGLGREIDEEVHEEFFQCVYFYKEAAGAEILRLRAELEDGVRSQQEKLLQTCFIELDDDNPEDLDGGVPPSPISTTAGTTTTTTPAESGAQTPKKKEPKPPPGPRPKQKESEARDRERREREKAERRANRRKAQHPGESDELRWMSRVHKIPMSHVQVLVGMGFSLPAVQRACVATMGQPLQATLDWLLRNVAEAKSAAVEELKLPPDVGGASAGGDAGGKDSRRRKDRSKDKRKQMLRVSVPKGVGPGQLIQVRTPYGRVVRVRVPRGHYPGSQFLLECSTPKSSKSPSKSPRTRSRSPGKRTSKSRRKKRHSLKESSSQRRENSSDTGQKRYLRFVVPEGAQPGDKISINTPEGNTMQLALPRGAYPGKQLRVEYSLQKKPKLPRSPRRTPTRPRDSRSGGGIGLGGRESTSSRRHEIMCVEKPFGMHLQEGTVIVVKVKGLAKRAGVRPGDRVLSMAGIPVDPTSWKTVYQAADPPFPIVILKPPQGPAPVGHGVGEGALSPRRRTVTVCVVPFGMTCAGRHGAVYVRYVEGEAARCGVRVGDRLERIAGQRVAPDTWKELFRSAACRVPFDIVLLPVGPPVEERKSLSVTRGAIESGLGSARGTSEGGRLIELEFDCTRPIGIELREAGGSLTILRTEPKTQAADRVEKGWTLLNIAGRRVTTRREVGAAMRQHRHTGAKPVPMLFYTGKSSAKPSPRESTASEESAAEAKWRRELVKMSDMGMKDASLNLAALTRANGNFDQAIQYVLSHSNQTSSSNAHSRSQSQPHNNSKPSSALYSTKGVRSFTHPHNGVTPNPIVPTIPGPPETTAPSSTQNTQEKLAQLRGMGFDNEEAMKQALLSAGGDVETACAMLLSEQEDRKTS